MSTRGIVGFKLDGEYRMTYNHSDSYPEGLGAEVVEFVRNLCLNGETLFGGWDRFKDSARKLILISDQDQPSEADAEYYRKLLGVSSLGKDRTEWYGILRNWQGVDYLKGLSTGALKHWPDRPEFIKDSLFCEYAYIVNLDNNTLDFYKGFQKELQPGNPFGAEASETGYYPCKLVASVALDQIPEDWRETIYPDRE